MDGKALASIGWKTATAKRGICFVLILPTLETTLAELGLFLFSFRVNLSVSRVLSLLEGRDAIRRAGILNSFLLCIFYQNRKCFPYFLLGAYFALLAALEASSLLSRRACPHLLYAVFSCTMYQRPVSLSSSKNRPPCSLIVSSIPSTTFRFPAPSVPRYVGLFSSTSLR